MQTMNLPEFSGRIREVSGKREVFDPLRQKFVALTPEEWVRQCFISYLTRFKGYPPTLLANEVSLSLNGMQRRCDTVLYDLHVRPRMIIEYKRPTVKITQRVFNQICRYNIVMKVDYLIVSNGIQHFCCKVDYENQKVEFLNDIPDYDQLQ